MKVEDVLKLDPIQRFQYWIEERHAIHMRKEAGLPKPWTDDKILQSYWFTNPYRENDRTTVWFREHIREPMRYMPEVLMATVIFRWFNLIETGELLDRECLLQRWDERRAVDALREANKKGPVFTGAYMIKAGNGPPGCKIPNVCAAITTVWNKRKLLLDECKPRPTLQMKGLWNLLRRFKYLGGFMSYEIVCDLRYTDLLDKAIDINTWTNLGPGAARGLHRLTGKKLISVTNKKGRQKPTFPIPKNWLQLMAELREAINECLPPHMPPFEMREVEHSLCEYDKYCRALDIMQGLPGTGKMKRRYRGL